MQSKKEKVLQWPNAGRVPVRCPVHYLPRWQSLPATDCCFADAPITHNEPFWYGKRLMTYWKLWLSMSSREDVLTFPCLRVLQLHLQQHQAWTTAGSLLLFLLHSHVELPPEGKCSHHLLPPFQTKPRGSQRHFKPVLHFRLPCCRVSSLQPIYLFCLWPFSRFPWCLCSLKSSAVRSATCSIVNTSKTVQTVG